MEKVTRYIANNGTNFDSETACISYENALESVETIMKQLPPKEDTMEFLNGRGYIQHDGVVVKRVWNSFR